MNCRYPDTLEERSMWGTLLKALLTSLEPQLKPLLNVLVQKVVELLLKNIGGNQAGGILSFVGRYYSDTVR